MDYLEKGLSGNVYGPTGLKTPSDSSNPTWYGHGKQKLRSVSPCHDCNWVSYHKWQLLPLHDSTYHPIRRRTLPERSDCTRCGQCWRLSRTGQRTFGYPFYSLLKSIILPLQFSWWRRWGREWDPIVCCIQHIENLLKANTPLNFF